MATIALLYLLLEKVLSQNTPAADGFVTNPCLRLSNFSLDGDWWAEEQGEVDWSSVLDGTRVNRSLDPYWDETQNQCSRLPTFYPEYRWGWWYNSGVFCDTFGTTETSLISPNVNIVVDEPRSWVPLIADVPGSSKYDLTNVFYVVSALENVICIAFEKLVEDSLYLTIEFNQFTNITCDPYSNTNWKCLFPQRSTSDFQIVFKTGATLHDSRIEIHEWNATSDAYDSKTSEIIPSNHTANYYESNDGAIRAAINGDKVINASLFGSINFPIEANLFFESCIDMTYFGYTSFNFNSIMMRTKSDGSDDTFGWKDTSGALSFDGRGLDPSLFDTAYEECGMTPTSSPTSPSDAPTRAPTATTNNPTATTQSPSDNPTKTPSVAPVTSPTQQPSATPSASPSTSPSVLTSAPSASPTMDEGIDGESNANYIELRIQTLFVVMYCIVFSF
eukprot:73862_1